MFSKQMNSQMLGSTLLPMVTDGLPKVSPAVGSSLTSIFFMPVVRPKLVVKAAHKLARSWRFCYQPFGKCVTVSMGSCAGAARSPQIPPVAWGHHAASRWHKAPPPCPPAALLSPYPNTAGEHGADKGSVQNVPVPHPAPEKAAGSRPALILTHTGCVSTSWNTDFCPGLPGPHQHQPANPKHYWVALSPPCRCSHRNTVFKQMD